VGVPAEGGRVLSGPRQRPLENRLKRAIKAGEPVLGIYSDTLDPTLVEALASAGFDYVVLDTEHNGYDIAACTESVRAAEAFGITPLIRVFDNNPMLINKALEIGAAGIVVPHVDTPELARQAVEATKYPPEGTRGVHQGTRATGFSGDWDVAWRRANEEVMVVLQPLESLRGIENLDAILQVPGIDLVSLGVGDISQVLGKPMQPNDPVVMEVRLKALDTCKAHGVATYALTRGNPAEAKAWFDRGVRGFMCGSDVGLVTKAATSLVSETRGALG
jgi:4-hydroxy-2-oxoheptanedioate aldolase